MRHRFHRRRTDGGERFGSFDPQPEIGMAQGLLQGIDGRRGASAHKNEALAGTVARVEARRGEHLDQRSGGGGFVLAIGHRGTLANDGRPALQSLEQRFIAHGIVERVPSFRGPVAVISDDGFRGGGVELWYSRRLFAGEMNFLERHRISEQVGAGAIPAVIAVVALFRRTLMRKAAVPLPREIKIPRAKLLHPRARGLRAAVRHAGHGPEHVEEIARVSGVALGAVRGQAHACEELRALGLAEQVEQHRDHAALAVVLMVFDPRMMIAIGDASFADVETQQTRSALDGLRDLRILHTRAASQHQPDGERDARRVHHAIAFEASV